MSRDVPAQRLYKGDELGFNSSLFTFIDVAVEPRTFDTTIILQCSQGVIE
jgi:hypothetical protein